MGKGATAKAYDVAPSARKMPEKRSVAQAPVQDAEDVVTSPRKKSETHAAQEHVRAPRGSAADAVWDAAPAPVQLSGGAVGQRDCTSTSLVCEDGSIVLGMIDTFQLSGRVARPRRKT